MAGKLEGLVVPVMEPLGYRHGWAGEVNRRIAEAAQGAPVGLELGWTDVNKVLTCPGWWEATRTTNPVPPNIIHLHHGVPGGERGVGCSVTDRLRTGVPL